MSAAPDAPPPGEAQQGRAPRGRLLDAADRLCGLGAGLTLLAMMTMTFVDVVGRYLFRAPLGFAFELTQIGMAILVFCALPSVTLRALHITVDLFEGLFRGAMGAVRDCVVMLAMAGCCLFVAWRLSILAARFVSYGDVTSTVRLPIGHVAWLGVGSFTLAALFILVNLALDISARMRSGGA